MDEQREVGKVQQAQACPSTGKYPDFRQRASLVVTQSPETVIEWIKENIHRAQPEKLYEALAVAIKMRDGE